MIAVSSGLKVLIATKPIDFRKGMDGLAALVKEHLGADPFSGTVFVFRAKRADRIKPIVWDGTGLCLFAKRLEEGTFRWPKIEDGIMRLTPAQLSALIEGLSERTLLLVDMLGGWIGAAFAQVALRHKVRKASFQIPFWIIASAHYFLCLVAGNESLRAAFIGLLQTP